MEDLSSAILVNRRIGVALALIQLLGIAAGRSVSVLLILFTILTAPASLSRRAGGLNLWA